MTKNPPLKKPIWVERGSEASLLIHISTPSEAEHCPEETSGLRFVKIGLLVLLLNSILPCLLNFRQVTQSSFWICSQIEKNKLIMKVMVQEDCAHHCLEICTIRELSTYYYNVIISLFKSYVFYETCQIEIRQFNILIKDRK